MSLTYIALPENEFGLVKALPFAFGFVFNRRQSSLVFLGHGSLNRPVADIVRKPTNEVEIMPLNSSKRNKETGFRYCLTQGGLILDAECANALSTSDGQSDCSAGSLTPIELLNDQQAMVMVQHAILVRGESFGEIPDFVKVKDNSIAVNHKYVASFLENITIKEEELPDGRGIRFVCVLADGFILAEHSCATLIACNNDPDAVRQTGVAVVKQKATEKLWELVGWQLRDWLLQKTKVPLSELFQIK